MREPVAPSRVGDQLQLHLGEPWNGTSPRYLTRAFLNRTIGGTGRAHQDALKAHEPKPSWKEDHQLWLFDGEVI